MLIRKLEEIGSCIYRNIVFPFVRIFIEIKTNSIMKQMSYINKGTVLRGKNYVGKSTVLTNVDVGFGTIIHMNSVVSNARIGKYCSLAPGLSFVGGKHPLKDNISTHPCFYAVNNVSGFSYIDSDILDETGEKLFSENTYVDEEKGYFYDIGNDVWIGANATIVQGVHIGDGAVIGTNALVLKDVDPYGIYAGIPAKKIGQRFSDDEIKKLLDFKWWDKDEKWIIEHAKEFSNVQKFTNDIK